MKRAVGCYSRFLAYRLEFKDLQCNVLKITLYILFFESLYSFMFVRNVLIIYDAMLEFKFE